MAAGAAACCDRVSPRWRRVAQRLLPIIATRSSPGSRRPGSSRGRPGGNRRSIQNGGPGSFGVTALSVVQRAWPRAQGAALGRAPSLRSFRFKDLRGAAGERVGRVMSFQADSLDSVPRRRPLPSAPIGVFARGDDARHRRLRQAALPWRRSPAGLGGSLAPRRAQVLPTL